MLTLGRLGIEQIDRLGATHVAVEHLVRILAHELDRQRVPLRMRYGCFHVVRVARDTENAQQFDAVGFAEMVELAMPHGRIDARVERGHAQARRDQAQARPRTPVGQRDEQRAHRGILQLAVRWPLQRFETVEDQEHPRGQNPRGERASTVFERLRHLRAEEGERPCEEILARSAALETLVVKRIAVDVRQPAVAALVDHELAQPPLHQRRFAHTTPGFERRDADLVVAQRRVECAQIVRAADERARRSRQQLGVDGLTARGRVVLRGVSNRIDDVVERVFERSRIEARKRWVVRVNELHVLEQRRLHRASLQQDAEELQLTAPMPFHEKRQLLLPHEVGGEKTLAHQQQSRIGFGQAAFDLREPVRTGRDALVAPQRHQTVVHERLQKQLEPLGPVIVLPAVADENTHRQRSSTDHIVVATIVAERAAGSRSEGSRLMPRVAAFVAWE
ncbi:MAG: hypothetical protein AAF772_04135 [Acidobacteriota bacterium]